MKSSTSAGLPLSSSVEGRSVTARKSSTVNCSALPDLLRREADAFAGVHGFEHVRDELLDFRRDRLDARRLFGAAPDGRI